MPVTLPEEQVVSCAGHDTALHVARPNCGDATIIELVPLIVSRTARISCVMTEAHVAVMVGHGVAIVDKSVRIRFGAFSTGLALDQVSKIEALERELDVRVDLLAVAASAIHTKEATLSAALLEALQVHDEDWRRLEDFHLLGSAHMILALVAVPFVVVVEHLGLAELFEAVLELDTTLIVVSGFIGSDLLTGCHT